MHLVGYSLTMCGAPNQEACIMSVLLLES